MGSSGSASLFEGLELAVLEQQITLRPSGKDVKA
jgi:hypothetical protein